MFRTFLSSQQGYIKVGASLNCLFVHFLSTVGALGGTVNGNKNINEGNIDNKTFKLVVALDFFRDERFFKNIFLGGFKSSLLAFPTCTS